MKQILFAVLIIIASLSFGGQAYAQTQETELSETINIESSTPNTGNRSLTALDAFYYPDSGIVEVLARGYGRLEVSIVDGDGVVYDYAVMYTDSYCTEELIAPSTPGTYCLILQSDSFFGRGTFDVQ